jgi:hypothetical protein
MKKTLLILCLALWLAPEGSAQTPTLMACKDAFTRSIQGLSVLKGSQVAPGKWTSTLSVPDCERTFIVQDEASEVLVLRAEMPLINEGTATDMLARLEDQMARMLPPGDYVRSQTYGGQDHVGNMKTVFDFNSTKMSDKQKHPTVEMAAVKTSAGAMVVISIYEPYFKNQYSPKF